MPKYRICDDIPCNCKTFNTLKDLVKWAQEEIKKNLEIKVGDIVTIEKFGDIYDTLDVHYFKELWGNTDIDSFDIYKIMIHYDYGCNYGIGFNHTDVKDRVKWKVLFIHDERVFIERHESYNVEDTCQVLCIKKSGLKKYEEV